MIADDPIPTVQVQDEAGQEIPEENAERAPIPPSGMLYTSHRPLLHARETAGKLMSQRRKHPKRASDTRSPDTRCPDTRSPP